MRNRVLEELLSAAQNRERVSGLTHNFYRYPARFSPLFARAAIRVFSAPGDIVLDPYMGGGTTIVEALASGRHAYGGDLNPLAVFVTKAKTTFLGETQAEQIWNWVDRSSRTMSFRTPRSMLKRVIDDPRAHNLTLPIARPTKKGIAAALLQATLIRDDEARDFARCVILRTAQWALDGRRCVPSLKEIRDRVRVFTGEMLEALDELHRQSAASNPNGTECVIVESDAAHLQNALPFCSGSERADLVVTSPPYPGVHVLYHRWQVNGRRETPAPYWIANCTDGQGAAFYNFGDRRGGGLTKYFDSSLETLEAVRCLVKRNGKFVQLVAFSDPDVQLPLYLRNMRLAGFDEIRLGSDNLRRIWREVPSRKWHASLKGSTGSSREVVLVHRAV